MGGGINVHKPLGSGVGVGDFVIFVIYVEIF